mmetsp:Transcript_42494/g.107220  ORF Transcript_42494/g.107220 Transcript_42494/m.107220 type:complete len:260 (-) Transcript_42494:391-1170(-)
MPMRCPLPSSPNLRVRLMLEVDVAHTRAVTTSEKAPCGKCGPDSIALNMSVGRTARSVQASRGQRLRGQRDAPVTLSARQRLGAEGERPVRCCVGGEMFGDSARTVGDTSSTSPGSSFARWGQVRGGVPKKTARATSSNGNMWRGSTASPSAKRSAAPCAHLQGTYRRTVTRGQSISSVNSSCCMTARTSDTGAPSSVRGPRMTKSFTPLRRTSTTSLWRRSRRVRCHTHRRRPPQRDQKGPSWSGGECDLGATEHKPT